MLKEEIIMRGKQLGFPRLSKKSHDNQATMIATIVQEAIEAEREACANVCETAEILIDIDVWHGSTKKEMTEHTALALAKAIRARGETTSRGEA